MFSGSRCAEDHFLPPLGAGREDVRMASERVPQIRFDQFLLTRGTDFNVFVPGCDP